MRLRFATLGFVAALGLFLATGAHAQEGVLTPAQSAAKAKHLIHEAIEALGGQAYLDVRDETCKGSVAFFGFHNELRNYQTVIDYNLYPDKERTEYSSKRNIIDVYNGDKGWSLDRGGVSVMSAANIRDFQNGLQRDINHLFRYRLNDPGLEFRYGGPDVVDLKQVDWVDVTDPEHLSIRIALDNFSHLPIRVIYISRNPKTHERNEEIEYFSIYHMVQGVNTPFQDTRTRNGNKVYQFFVRSCSYNTGLKPDFFTRESLEERWKQLGGNKKKKKKHFF